MNLFACFALLATLPSTVPAAALPTVNRTVLANGMVLYWEENHELPLFSVSALVRVGSIYEPADRVGLAELTGRLLESGGAGGWSADSLEQELDFRALNLGSRIGREEGSVSVSGRAVDLGRGLDVFEGVLRAPRFDSGRLELERSHMYEDLRRQNDDPDGIVGREFNYLVYGPSSPWARTPDRETLARITRRDVADFWRRYYVPNSMIVTVYGDFRADSLLPLLRARLAAWPRVAVDFPAVAPVVESYTPGLYLVERDLDESYIAMGHLGLRRHDPDIYAVTVMNRIMSSGTFTSRLGNEVRTIRGLSYSVGGSLGEGADRGVLWLGSQTRSNRTIEAIEVMKATVAGMLTAPPSPAELRSARETLVNRFVFELDGWGRLIGRRASLEFYGYPSDYLETYRDRVNAVTGDDILRVARAHLHPDGLKILVLGTSARFERPLTTLGPVTPITLPETRE